MILALALILMVIAYPLQGWVLSVLWRWFMVPAFGLPELRVPLAIGVAIVVGFLTYHPVDCETPKRERYEVIGRAIVSGIGGPLLTLLIALIVKQFI